MEDKIKKISFPSEEHEALKKQDKIVTTRVSADYDKFFVGDLVETPWKLIFKVVKRQEITDIKKHPFYSELTKDQIEFLSKYNKIAVLTLEKEESVISLIKFNRMKITEDDLKLILEGINLAADASNDPKWSMQDLKKYLEVKPNIFFIKKEEEKIGIVFLGIDGGHNEIGNFAIFKKYQGKGYGLQALKVIIDYLRKLHPGKDIEIGVAEKNTKAVNLYKKVGFKITKTGEEKSGRFYRMTLDSKTSVSEESMDEFASEAMQDTISKKKMYFADNNGKIPKDKKQNPVLVKSVEDAKIYFGFNNFWDESKPIYYRGITKVNGVDHLLFVHGDDSTQEVFVRVVHGIIYEVEFDDGVEFRLHGNRGFGCKKPLVYTAAENVLQAGKIHKLNEETCSVPVVYKFHKELVGHASEDLELDISAELLQEFNAGIEEFNHWVRSLVIKHLKDELNDEQVNIAVENMALENVLTDTVKTIFRKIGEFIAWFLKKLKDLWNYFFGKTQRATRALKAANEKINRHKNSNGFFNDGAFEAAPIPQGMISALGMDLFLTMGFSPDAFNPIFTEILKMWAEEPQDLYEEIFVRYSQSPTTHRWHPTVAFMPTGGPNSMDAMTFTKNKYKASGSMRDAGYDRDSVLIVLKEAMDAIEGYEKNSKLIASKGNVASEAARRVLEYQERTDVTEHEAMQMAKDIQELANFLQMVFKSYEKAYEFILEQSNMVANTYMKYMK